MGVRYSMFESLVVGVIDGVDRIINLRCSFRKDEIVQKCESKR